MSDAVVQTKTAPVVLSHEVFSALVLAGDLSKLSPMQKVEYVKYRCQQLGLDAAAKPFEVLKLQGKEVLYATSACTQQLCESRGLSTSFVSSEQVEDVLVITAKCTDKEGRSTENVGAVTIGGLKGDALANALMKCRTKALRRSVLSHCGLGMLDETEIATIPGAQMAPLTVSPQQEEVVQADVEPEPEKVSPGDTVVPFGTNKGKKVSELSEDTLRRQIEWAEKNSKYPEYIATVKQYLADSFGGAFDTPAPVVHLDKSDASVALAHSAGLKEKAVEKVRTADEKALAKIIERAKVLVSTGELLVQDAQAIFAAAEERELELSMPLEVVE